VPLKNVLTDLFRRRPSGKPEDVWRKAKISRINKKGTVFACPYCGDTRSEVVLTWRITDHYGLFDDSPSRLNRLYAAALSPSLPREQAARRRSETLKALSGLSQVDFRKCRSCDLVYQNYPHTSASVNFYYRNLYRLPWQETHVESGTEIYGRSDERWTFQQQSIGTYFLSATGIPEGSKVIDVGCAEGIVCEYLKGRGIEAFGIDASLPMTNYARLVLGLDNIYCDDYSTGLFPQAFFDGIVSHHTIEHVPDVRGFFDALSKQLRIGGYLLIQTPCFDNLIRPEDYNEALQGGHIYCFSEGFLRSALESRGFEIMELKRTPCDLSQLDSSLVAPFNTTVWADDPGGISILARNSGKHED
jgi:2-polyprenyl-3-methyl-5-hydroxy-6-metoxy-1,4-benzoquinol methylase